VQSDNRFGLTAKSAESEQGLGTTFEASSQSRIMSQLAEDTTNPTLLGRLSQVPNDAHAWSQFVDRYGPRICVWCRRWGLQEADSHDVQQSVLMRLVGVMQTFQYFRSKSFRSWLKTLTQHAWSDLVRNRKFPALGGVAADNLLESITARDDLTDAQDPASLGRADVRPAAKVSARGAQRWPGFGIPTSSRFSMWATPPGGLSWRWSSSME
jgi:RNA polymerase sigma-70 factor (ECF subfamily)